MKQNLLFFFLFLMLSATAFSQTDKKKVYLGLSMGASINHLHTSTGYRENTFYENGTGFTISVPIRYEFNNWIALQAEPGYIAKNYSLTHNYMYENSLYNIYNNDWINRYIQLPVMAHFSVGGKKLRAFLNAGGFIGYQAGSKIKGSNYLNDRLYAYNEKFEFDSHRDNRLECGLLAGLGARYDKKQWSAFVEGRFCYGLSDLQKDYMLHKVPRYNNTYVIQAGILFNLTPKR